MLFPIRTDTPIRFFPYATIVLIVANVAAFILSLGNPEGALALALPWGEGFTPIRWLTSKFLHADFVHLAGNMLFLWVFGLVVEGKIGPAWFVPLYLGIGGVESAIEQVLFWNALEGGSLGASSAIYGILAIACLWAPRDGVDVVYWMLGAIGTFRVSIRTVAFFYIGFDLLTTIATAAAPSTALLHVLGAAVGVPAGLLLLRLGAVEIRSWDHIAAEQRRRARM